MLKALVDGSQTWAQAMAKFPVVRTGDEGEEEENEGAAAAGGGNGGKANKGPTVVEKTPRGKFSRPAEAESLEGKLAGMKL